MSRSVLYRSVRLFLVLIRALVGLIERLAVRSRCLLDAWLGEDAGAFDTHLTEEPNADRSEDGSRPPQDWVRRHMHVSPHRSTNGKMIRLN